MDTEIIPISPKTDFLFGASVKPAEPQQDDTPTVAETFLPYATAQAAEPIGNVDISLSRISKAWARTTGFQYET
jgi:hypothetical protein